MILVKKRGHRIVMIIVGVLSILIGCLLISTALLEHEAYFAPDYAKIDIIPVLSKKQLNKADYEILFYQTGLGKPAIDELREGSPDSTLRILYFQAALYRDIHYICEKNSPISKEESVVDENNSYINGTELAILHNGFILITKASHTYGWRNGHAALIVDAAQGATLESVVWGTNSCLQHINKWTNYPDFMLFRLKNASSELLNEIAQSALKNMNDIPYDFMVGIWHPKFRKAEEITVTHCSHLVWEAFRLFDYDLDSDGGMIVTPKDIANSPNLEVVQVFGVNPKEIWP